MDHWHGRNWLAEIVAMLFSLAAMAQFAATASPRHRRHLLDIMRAAEASGVRVAIGEGLIEGDHHPFGATEGYSPEDAMRLAVCLRALAMMLYFPAKLGDRPREKHPLVDEHTTLATWLIVARALPGTARAIPQIDTS